MQYLLREIGLAHSGMTPIYCLVGTFLPYVIDSRSVGRIMVDGRSVYEIYIDVKFFLGFSLKEKIVLEGMIRP